MSLITRKDSKGDTDSPRFSLAAQRETNYLVGRFLASNPAFQKAYVAYREVLDKQPDLLPTRRDYTGQVHGQTYDEVVNVLIYTYRLHERSAWCYCLLVLYLR